ncbi:methyl-accepting chemotaxis protein [Paenibacillus sp. L3-i20]|uniref:methyl-accepting chemotaxis protein n=1 Tax=Paenibacillus sp. L3-i20 TaxID=2905833 RepID=UPI001EDFDF2B|nr:methyl-accepting chemotaxis protein [Paenibacillus sp. L3-i20]GKU77681.1 hypothetical protein L3i20_v220780 [Paenibacillus sp. L3-i20]
MSIVHSLKLKNVKLRTKIIIVLSIPTLALILTTAITFSIMKVLTADKSQIYSSANLSMNADRDMYQAYSAVQSLLIFDTQSNEFKQSKEDFLENVQQVNERIATVKELVHNIKELETYQHSGATNKIDEPITQFQKDFGSWVTLSTSIIEEKEASSNELSLQPIVLTLNKLTDSYTIARDELNEIGEINTQYVESRIVADEKIIKSSKKSLMITVSVAIVIVIVLSIILIRVITRPINKLVADMNQLSQGDFTIKTNNYDGKDEIGQLMQAVNSMVISLKDLFRKANDTSTHVAWSSKQLTASTQQTVQATNQITMTLQDIASGAETQGAGAEESARAMKEISIGIQRVAETTSSVSDAALETQKEANQGNESIQKVIQQMNEIHRSTNDSAYVIRQLGERSSEIGKIVEVITGIANQTNLLALNAAIEAARAGEHGRGFAVVASEVKKLAEQSKNSSEQISHLIQLIQKDTLRAVEAMEKGTQDVKMGMDVVQETGEGFRVILKSVEEVVADIQEVSAVSEQMSASVEQVYTSIEHMANFAVRSASSTQSAAAASEEQLATIEEITSSAASLTSMADELRVLVGKFKL